MKRRNREKALIRRGKAGLFSYVILPAESRTEQLEIIHSAFLAAERYRRQPPFICGVAKSRMGAIRLVGQIAADATRAGMPGELRRYLERLETPRGLS